MSIAKNSAVQIFEAVADGGRLSRAELSKLTGYSLMTVGKAVDALERGGLLTQEKCSSGSVGRNMSVCCVSKECGMLIYDLSKETASICICDMCLNVIGEVTSELDDFSSLMAEGFGYFLELSRGELLGIGCIAPEGREMEYSEKIKQAMGNPPELAVSPKLASAAANVSVTKPEGLAVFVRTCADKTDMLLWNEGFMVGAHGRGADCSFIKNQNELSEKLADLCMIADPETVHITAYGDYGIADEICTILTKRGVADEFMPRMITVNGDIDTAVLNGAAILLREKLVLQKMADNS